MWSFWKKKPTIDVGSALGFVVIVKSGFNYCNQAGGYACMQPMVEGVFVPLPHDLWLKTTKVMGDILYEYFTKFKYGGWCCEGIDEEDADYLDEFFVKYELPVKVDRTRLKDSMEAWIFVEFTDEFLTYKGEAIEYPVYKDIRGMKGVFVWENSD